MEASEFLATQYEVVEAARSRGLAHVFVEDTPLDGLHIQVDGRRLTSFGSCSYLGLEQDERLKVGVEQAVRRYGTQFSASRTYLSAPPFRELEERLSALFGGAALPTSSTTLGHLSALPVLVQERDAIIMDQMVHHSVQLAATHARAHGATVELVRHGDLVAAERALERLTPVHRHVWMLLDGVYSMFGDLPDVAGLRRLLDRFPTLHLYVDDAHGMSIAGLHGRGVHLSRQGWHPRLVLATSLNKAFACAGGCLVFPDPRWRDQVRLCGGTFTFGGPIQPPMLGAALASAALHLSPEISRLQDELQERVRHFNQELSSRALPLLENNLTPIFFIRCGPNRLAYALGRRLKEEGFFATLATYPAVPMKRSGLRLSITRHHSLEVLTAMAQALAHHLPLALDEVHLTREEVDRLFAFREHTAQRQLGARVARAFGGEGAGRPAVEVRRPPRTQGRAGRLTLQHETTVNAFPEDEWKSLLGQRGLLSQATLLGLERTFRDRPEPEHRWGWHYLVVRDGDRPVAATFLTEALWKDDMLARAEVSERVELARRDDPYHLTSRALSTGCLLTEGDHLFLDRQGHWREGLDVLLDALGQLQRQVAAKSLVVRDLPSGDRELDEILLSHGLLKVPMLSGHRLDLTAWSDDASFLATLGSRTRRRVRAEVLDVQGAFWTQSFRCGVDPVPTPALLNQAHELYRRVKARKRRLNTFDLPPDIFERLWAVPGWDLFTLHLSAELGGPADGTPVAVALGCLNGATYTAVVAGLDGHPRGVSVYRQLLWQTMQRARALGASTLELGMDAEREKARMGALPVPQCAYVHLADHASLEVLAQLAEDVALLPTRATPRETAEDDAAPAGPRPSAAEPSSQQENAASTGAW